MPELRPPSPAVPDHVVPAPRRTWYGVAVLIGGVAASVVALLAVRHLETGRDLAEFQRRAHTAGQVVRDGLQRHEETLHSLRNLFHFSNDISREEFAGAASDMIARQRGIRALEWVQRIPHAQRASFEAEQRAQGVSNFIIRDRIAGSELRPSPERAEYFPVVFIEPVAGNENAFGFDLQSGSTWPILERIASTGEMASSGRLPLITTDGRLDWGYITELPVYGHPLPGNDPAQRRERLRGYVLAIFHMSEMIESFFSTENADALDILFLDRSAPVERQFLHYHAAGEHGPAPAPSSADIASQLHIRLTITHAGRLWEVWLRPSADWLASRSHVASWLTFALGLAITGLGSSYVFGATRREQLVGRLVAERTAELRKTQAALEQDIRERRETERQLSNVISQLPGAAFRCTFDERLTMYFASDGMFQLTGYAADDFVSGRISVTELTFPEDRAATRGAVAAALEQRAAFEVEYRIRDREGTERTILVRGRPVYADDGALRFIEGLAIDVSALKAAEREKLALERRILETQKFESLGVLAGGIAHDFNNLLTAMLGNATLAKYALPANTPAAEHLGHIEQAARRAADLCQQMLAYAGKKELRAKAMNISGLVRLTAGLLRVSMNKNTRLELRLDEHIAAILADPAQVQQIVMNLVLNAADAIGDNFGEITITTTQRYAAASFLETALHRPQLPSGLYVVLEVKDTGCGMTPETMSRIFEPFFTTKFSGRGLGLAAVLGIVHAHRAALFVESQPGVGSTFRLLLQAEVAQVVTPEPPRPVVDATLQGRVLVVDDEPAVREVLGTVLSRAGMVPTIASSGEEALQLYSRPGESFDLVLLDLTMPGLSGEETLRAIREQNREQRVILMSGYSERDTMARCTALGVTDFIAKPFELPSLLAKLQLATG